MEEWNQAVRKMAAWMEGHADEDRWLLSMSREIGYSPTYCSYLFHQATGMTLRSYMAAVRIQQAVRFVRDTDKKLLDIAVSCGYSSHEALTRAFVKTFGRSPNDFRKHPVCLPSVLPPLENLLANSVYGGMAVSAVQEANVRLEYIPAHRYIGIWDKDAGNYGEFWNGRDCDAISDLVESLRPISHDIVGPGMAGWMEKDGKSGYFYGTGVPADYNGEVPEGFTLWDVPESLYLVFFHPPFDYAADNAEVMSRVEKLAWSFDPARPNRWWIGYEYAWNNGPAYQRHCPEVSGYEVLRPVKRIR